jgi:asparagine synthase (glutamine-hydrolysing)
MCGIAGIFVNDPADLDRADLSRLGAALAHRGPDGEGIWISDDCKAGLVHRRLAIIDTSVRGHQPMHSQDRNFTIVYNGEIYNFIELRAELEALGSQFRSDSDTEVILEAWRHWGEAMLERFNGMWALVIRDNRSGDVFMSRDRFGIKPFLYSHGNGRFSFASEMRALRLLAHVDGTINTAAAKRMLFDPFSIEGSESTLFGSIGRLPGGHMAWLRNGELRIKRWWRTTDHLIDPPHNERQRAERFRELFYEAIRIRMRSDVPLGTCLSGGFDSSAIVSGMMHVADGRSSALHEAMDWRHAFIASFPGQPNDETPEANEAAAYAGVTAHLTVVKNDDALADIESVLSNLDDVYISLPTAPWQIYRELRRSSVTVSLDGHGADELMGAYRQQGDSFGFQLRNQLARLTSSSNNFSASLDSAKATWFSVNGLNFLRGHRLIAPEGLGLPSDFDELPREWGPLNRRLYRMFHATVLPTILRNFDRLSMAHGIEVRMPFMDWRLVAYVMSLPDSAKSSNGYSKWVARAAMEDQMPESIRMAKRKVGFNSPMPGWMNGPLRSWMRATLDRPNEAFDELVEASALRARVESLSQAQQWDWQKVGRLWPYIHLKWLMDGNLAKAL